MPGRRSAPRESQTLRVENTARSGPVSSRGSTGRASQSDGFFVDDGGTTQRAAAAPPVAASAGIEALLALQAVEDPMFAKRKALRRGNALLDALESIKADMLVGRVSEGRLNQVMALIGQARERNLPGLDDLLDDIELRARVELAKFGRYPNP